VTLGIASAVSEELFFRGLLATVIGLVASSLAFGLLHQMRGPARWAWAAWATVMGLLFGVLFFATGSLLGPMVAHAAINVANLRFIRDTDVDAPTSRRLGGLLGPRRPEAHAREHASTRRKLRSDRNGPARKPPKRAHQTATSIAATAARPTDTVAPTRP